MKLKQVMKKKLYKRYKQENYFIVFLFFCVYFYIIGLVIKMKKIVLAGSSKFIEQIQYWKKYFEENGYEVIGYPKKIDQTDYSVYQNTHKSFFEALTLTDELFVVNEDKNGIKGYVGAETFAELSYVVVNNILKNENKKIYLLKRPSEEVNSYYELNAFLNLGYIEIWNEDKK